MQLPSCQNAVSSFLRSSRLGLALGFSLTLFLLGGVWWRSAAPNSLRASAVLREGLHHSASGAPMLPGAEQPAKLENTLAAAFQAARYQWYRTAKPQTNQAEGVNGDWMAANPAQRLTTALGATGVKITGKLAAEAAASPSQSHWEMALKLDQYGYGDELQGLTRSAIQTKGKRVEISHTTADKATPPLIEWYVNETTGLEQGFTLAERPPTKTSGQPLRLRLTVTGDLVGALDTTKQRIIFKDSFGAPQLNYSKLAVWDAQQQPMPARLQLQGQTLWIEVDEAQAIYPLTIDPTFTQFNKLTANDSAANDFFGSAVAVDGDTAIIGAPGDDNARGAAYVFVKAGANWSFQQKLTASDGSLDDSFGRAVDVSGNLAVVGQYAGEFSSHSFRGGAYVFVRSGTTWTQQQLITSGLTEDGFGVSVGISGTTAVVGAPEDNTGASDRGAVYVYTQGPSPFFTWFQQQKLLPGGSDLAANDNFGMTVAVNPGNNNLLMIGAPRHLTNRGAVYYFSRSGSTWTQQQRLLTGDGIGGDFFGEALAFDGTTALIGVPKYNPGTQVNRGAAYIFTLVGASYTQQAGPLVPTDATTGDQFGIAVAISGETAIIGAVGDDVGANVNQGSAYEYERVGTSWTNKQKLLVTDGAANDAFGKAVGLSGNNAIIGASGNAANRGAAYSFTGSDAFPKQTPLLAGDAANLDQFGTAVAISGDTVVVGAPYDDIGGAVDRGSVYVFVRTHTPPAAPVWSQQAKLTASNGVANDLFGQAVAISGDVLIAARAGNAYIFDRTGSTWTERVILTPSPSSQLFGAAVAIFGHTALVGAPGDDTAGTDRGAAHVYVKTGGTWQLQQKITPGDGANGDFFGGALAVNEETALIGAQYDDNGTSLTDEGSAYIFTRSGAVWSQQTKLLPNDAAPNRRFGAAVALSGNSALIGTPDENSSTGAAYVFLRTGTTWGQQQKLVASDKSLGDRFGHAVSVSGNVAVVGAFADEVNGKLLQGSAYVFTRTGASWSQVQRLAADLATGNFEDAFGLAVAASGDTVVVGAPFDDVNIANQGSVCVFDNWPTAKIDLAPTTLANGAVGSPYSQTLTGSGGTGPYTFSLIGGVLPSGMTLSSAGALSGTPSGSGTFNFTVLTVDATGCSGARSYTLFACGTITVNPATLPGGVLGASYSQTLNGAGGAGSYSFTVTGGALPGGLALNASTGVLAGTLNASGNFSFTIRATDSGGCFGERVYLLTVAACTTLTVNNLGDTPDASVGNGLCADAGGQCTLRAAIEESNALGCGTTINFSVTGTINLGGVLPDLNANVTINGPGAALLTVRRNVTSVFDIFTIATSKTASINALTVNNGRSGIVNNGNLTLSGCVVTGNQRTDEFSGGGIRNFGTLTATNCTISNNSANEGSALISLGVATLNGCSLIGNSDFVVGGIISPRVTGVVNLTNCTLSGNSGPGGLGYAILIDPGTTATLSNCTVTSNTGGLAFRSGGGTLNLKNTIVAGNTGGIKPDIDAVVTSQGNNLIGNSNGGSGFVASDLLNVNPRLAALTSNGGPTLTHALRCDSPAIDAGTATGAPATDQRGLTRNADGNGDNTSAVDIGAFETQKIVVTNTNDGGAGSLRQAITDNNATGGSLIAFNITGAGVKTITPLSAMPAITKSVDINGYTQPGSSPNALATGNNAVLLIELNGTSAGANVSGLTCNAGSSCVRGLAINRFNSHGVHLLTGNDNLVAGNIIGTNVAGSAASYNNVAGVEITYSRNNTIGGNTPAARNLLSGNFYGIRIGSPSPINQSGNNVIQGNYIGTNATGTAALGNTNTGVQIEDAVNNLVGGATAGERNLISGNNDGVLIFAQFGATNPSTGNVVKGNFIGTAAGGTTALGNTQNGVSIGGTFGNTTDSVIGGTLPGEQNVIAFNTGRGILFDAANNVRNRALSNLIFSNGGLGIDLGNNGVTANDTNDADTGPNNLQNFPTLSSVTSGGTVSGSLDSATANSAYPMRIEFFANTACDSSSNGEGEVFLGFTTLNAPGGFTLSFTPIAGKPFITATATDNNGNTSEFSACRQVCPLIAVNPPTLPGGTSGVAYSQTISQAGGNGATSFNLSAGALPNGLTLSTAGLISGTPSANGNFNFTVRATDSNGCMGERAYTVIIGSCPTITINPATLPNGLVGTNYNQTLTTTGGASPYSFAVTAGALPPGLLLTGGILSGNPTASGTFNFTVAATDNTGCIGTRAYTLLICGPIIINPASLPAGALGVAYNQNITQTGASSPSFSISAGALPGGLSLNASTGALTGTPTATGSFGFTVRATDTSGCFGERAYTLTINACGNVTVNSIVLPSAVLGMNYFQQMTATGGVAPYSFALSAGALPVGLSLAANGQITGAPTSIGSSTFTVRATDANNCQGTRQYTLYVNRKFSLTADDGAAVDWFGRSVAISGDTVVVGAVQDDVGANANQGSAYVYVRSGGNWVLQQKLLASDGAANDEFGVSVAIFGDTIVVGADLDDVGANTNQGAAYVFTRAGGVWTQQQKLVAPDGGTNNYFGYDVAIHNQTILIGHFGNVNAAYVFQRVGTVWSQQQKLSPNVGQNSEIFGFSVALEGDTAVIGSVWDQIGSNLRQGSTYVFTRAGSVWTQQQRLTVADGAMDDLFGHTVAISGDTLITSSPAHDVGGNSNQGAAYVFTRAGGVWTQQQKLTAADGGTNDSFGYASLEGNRAIIGSGIGNTAYVFTRAGTLWSQEQKLSVPGQAWNTAINNGVMVVGTFSTTIGGNASQGSACVFDNCPLITISPATLPAGGLNTAYNQMLTASGGSAPYSFDIISGALPTGLSLSAAGVLAGTPTASGTFNFTVRATPTGGCTGTQNYTLVIGACPIITVTPATLPNTAFGANYNQTLTAAGGADPYSFTVTAGALPTGLSLSEFSGLLSGPVNATGSFSFTVRATDQNGCSGERMYTIVVGPCATLTVNSLGDAPDANPGNGLCADADGQCTLRAAIQENNALGCGTTINFSVTGTINLSSALPVILTNATINGPGADLLTVRRDSAATFSVLRSSTVNTTLNGLTITNGNDLKGGGIFSNGGLTINHCVIFGNQTTAGGEGGGIWASGTLTINNSTIFANSTPRFGGGIHIGASTASLTNCTISRNSATDGAGIYNTFGSTTTLTNCTITANTATRDGGGVDVRNGAVTARNTIFADNTANTGPDVRGMLTSQGNNLIGNTADVTGLLAADLQNVNPQLASLAMNGDATLTHALRCDSPAIDAGTSIGAPATDQRGLARNADGNGDNANAVDIGAFETQKLIVTNTNDSGAGSLRQAILDNNATGGSLITFNIPGTGVNTIAPLSALPTITRTVDINGYTQPGSRPNTQSGSNNAVLLIELSGATAGNANGLVLQGGASCVRGLVINRFNMGAGIRVIGGLGANGNKNLIQGNVIGRDATHTGNLGNQTGIILGVNNNLPGPQNNLIGGTAPAEKNVIAGNNEAGVSLRTFGFGSGNAILGNVIFGNGQLGIDLLPDGVTLNDAGDPDTGDNKLQNFPLLTSATGGVVNGSLDSLTANSAYPIRLEFFANTACNASGNGEGEAFLGFTTLTAPGNFTFNYTPVAGKSFITATATDNDGNTSEFSACRSDALCPAITVNPVNPSLPNGREGIAYSQTFTQTGGAGVATFNISAGALPAGLTLTPGGLLAGTPTVSGSFNFTVKATDANGCLGTRAYALFLNPACTTITLTPATLPSGVLGTPYNQNLTATGGTPSYSFALTGGSLPSGLQLASTGTLTGIPAALGTFNFTVTATDINQCLGQRQYALIISCPAITLNPPSLPNGQLGAAYNQQFTQSGGTGIITWSSTGPLPNNVSLNSATGLLAGTPTAAGTFSFTARATDANGCFGEQAYTLVIGICPAITITPANLPSGLVGTTYNQTLTANGGTPSYTFTFNTGALPTGLTLTSNGTLSGTPSAAGAFTFTIRATDSNGCFGERAYTVTSCANITVNPASVPAGTVGTAYSQTFTQTGGSGAITWSVSAGSLPGGLSLNAGSGVLSGTPTGAGSSSFTVRATDANGCLGERPYTLTINPAGNGLQFYPLASPVRLLDTRPGASPNACSQPNAQIARMTSRTQPARNFCTIPANAVALTGNVTTVDSGGAFLTLYPGDAALPTAASTNFNANEIVNNVFTVGLSASDGAFKIYAEQNADVVVDVTGYFAPPSASGLYFHPLPAPVRLFETRLGEAGCVTPGAVLLKDTDTLVQARTGCTGIPAAARAIVGNATTVNPQEGSYITLYPGNVARPFVATSNFYQGQTVNGPFTVGLAPTGEFKIYTTVTTDLVVDILGYYSTEAIDANGVGLLFTPLATPVRLLETRANPSNLAGCFKPNAKLNAQQVYTQPARGVCQGQTIAANALAVVGNATVVFPALSTHMTFWPSSAAQPNAATSNYTLGSIVNRHFIVGLGNADGAFKLISYSTTDLVIDLTGYFAP